ncbi:hypothetical protein [Jannaschia aquimarina]|uniref:Alpha/beta hydrolase family protein n=1 Tax=Jannaschia aquimarina TaxID=935700 RepID=A0A0D1ENZ7_9RHOB|nr:hypothetical protein [Jannaschia aquimarina]KIT17360.1 hypothetical protein jaqu_10920 [Jannaschia aquimarina]SNT20900.1 hypothetical protein SAMN05421775_107218 [Jannaschia aquimarina]
MSDVRRRKVFYIPGYDPFHPRRYRELYRKEGAEQARLSGYEIALSKGESPYSWVVDATIDGRDVRTEMEVLVWSDIVQRSMDRSLIATYVALVRTAWTYIVSGALFRLMRLRKGPVIAALYPIVVLLGQLAVAAVLAGLVFRATRRALDWIAGKTLFDPFWSGLVLAAVLGGLTGWAVLALFRRYDNRIFAHYLMHDYAFSARYRGAIPPALEQRMQDFAMRIRAASKEDWDEVLVVGHSSGAHLGVSILAGLVRDGLAPGRVAFLSLGHVVPMVSFLPDANALRADLHLMGAQGTVPWVDVTAPGDGCAFALCDPVAVSGVAPEAQRWPLVISAAFTQTLSPARWAELRRRYFRLHFQYLCAFDALPGTPSDYDYFRITGGPRTLADHFAGRGHSPSRMTRPVNRFTAMAA